MKAVSEIIREVQQDTEQGIVMWIYTEEEGFSAQIGDKSLFLGEMEPGEGVRFVAERHGEVLFKVEVDESFVSAVSRGVQVDW